MQMVTMSYHNVNVTDGVADCEVAIINDASRCSYCNEKVEGDVAMLWDPDTNECHRKFY